MFSRWLFGTLHKPHVSDKGVYGLCAHPVPDITKKGKVARRRLGSAVHIPWMRHWIPVAFRLRPFTLLYLLHHFSCDFFLTILYAIGNNLHVLLVCLFLTEEETELQKPPHLQQQHITSQCLRPRYTEEEIFDPNSSIYSAWSYIGWSFVFSMMVTHRKNVHATESKCFRKFCAHIDAYFFLTPWTPWNLHRCHKVSCYF